MTGERGFTYGPVPSRRLGFSLGVDVVPLKVCSYDCIYCQLGPTRQLSTERVMFFPVQEIVADVERRLGLWPKPDVITVAGSGEPTLYAGMGELIAAGTHRHANEILKSLGGLERAGEVHRVVREGRVFWHAIAAPSAASEALG